MPSKWDNWNKTRQKVVAQLELDDFDSNIDIAEAILYLIYSDRKVTKTGAAKRIILAYSRLLVATESGKKNTKVGG